MFRLLRPTTRLMTPYRKYAGKEEKKKKEKPVMDIKDKVIIITGGASGIGKATVEQLVGLGAKVSILDVDAKKGKLMVSCMNNQCGFEVAMFCKCDVSNLAKLRGCFKETEKKMGCIHAVFNNAGIWNDSLKSWSKQVDVNVKGTINGCILAMEFFGKQNGGPGGTVINSGAKLGIKPWEVMPIHSATKAAVIALTRALGTDLHYKLNKIRFMCICPNVTETPLFDKADQKLLIQADDMEDKLEEAKEKFSYQEPENVAEAVIEMLKSGKNGNCFYVQDDKPGQLIHFKEKLSSSKKGGKPSARKEV